MQKLYENIRARRRQLGLTQAELAERTGYTNTTSISKIETGRVDLPQSKIPVFAAALHTTPEQLLGFEPVFQQSAAQHLGGQPPEEFAGYLDKKSGLLIPRPTPSKEEIKAALFGRSVPDALYEQLRRYALWLAEQYEKQE